MAAIAAGVGLLVVCSSSVAAAMMMGGEEKEDPVVPKTPVVPVLGPPIVVDVPTEFRTSTTPWRIVDGREAMKNHMKGRLDDPQAWISEESKVGTWYQMDNGKIAEISGVAIKGRLDCCDQWVLTFKVKYMGSDGIWKDVDGGKGYTGNTDRDTQVNVDFTTPVTARYIRIYPQTWNNHISLRAGLITNDTLDASAHKLLNIPADKRASSSWWNNNDDPNWHASKGVLGSETGWHPKSGAPDDGSEWYELQMDSPTDVTGVALQGRSQSGTQAWIYQWTTTFTAQYKDTSGNWVNVDDGFVYSGSADKDTTVWAPFNAPVNTTAVRIYPKTWHEWMTGRFDLLGPSGSSEGYRSRPVEKEIEAFSFY
jgi:hypothetical protein